PEVEVDWARAPELAVLMAVPVAVASPVSPVSPESPEKALVLPPATAKPRRPALTAFRLTVAGPVAPLAPELPLMAKGLDSAVDVAGPVLPVLVDEDCDHDRPESPERAVGLAVTL